MNPKCRNTPDGKPIARAPRPALDLLVAVALALAAWLLASGKAHAATESTEIRCVSDSAQLADALLDGNQSPNVNVAIRLRQGTYTISGINTSFAAPMSIRGGWSDVDCADNAARTINPFNTIIDLSGSKFSLKQPEGPPRASIVIEGVTFRNGDSVEIAAGTTHDLSNDPGDIVVRRTRFTGFSPAGTPFATLDFDVATGSGLLENVLMDHIWAPNSPTCAVGLYVDGGSASFGANYVTADIGGPVCLANGPSAYVSNSFDLSNSIFWSSEVGPPTVVTLRNSDQSTIGVNGLNSIIHLLLDQNGNPVSFAGQMDVDPAWVAPASGDYLLAFGSAAIDTGLANAPLGMPATDTVGQVRPTGPAPDVGAFEWTGGALPSLVVSNTNDSGAGSLRQAIIDADAHPPNSIVEIVFQLPGSCPQTIALQSALPSITNGVRISGYTQPESTPNSDDLAFDANICVVVKPASGTLPTALRVPSGPNGSLRLSGVALGGFDQPILLLGGGEHAITGIQIGGNVNGVALPGPALNGISVATGSVGGIYIGGPDPSERNVIGGGGVGKAINLQPGQTLNANGSHCRVVNNLIGLAQNGTSALTIARGINLSSDRCSVIGNRIAGTSYEAIWVNGGDYNVVQGNSIGFNIDGLSVGAGQTGVLASGNASANILGGGFNDGMTAGSPLANTIRYMSKGVIIQNDSVRNSIRGNTMTDLASANPIDLGDDGPTANDFNDTDYGPNDFKNFATVQHLAYLSPPTPDAVDVQAYVFGQLLGSEAGINRIDAYFYNGNCAPGERGRAERYLGSFIAYTFASGNPSNFNYAITLPNIATDGAIAFTATDQNGNTSELGTCYGVANAPTWDDVIFWNDFE
jgi:trimeric autotransporter adhesin